MKVLIYSPTHHHRDLYTAMEKELKSKGYSVYNPYLEGDPERTVHERVLNSYNKVNMVMLISPQGKSKQMRDLRELCRKACVLWRKQDGDDNFFE